MAATAQSLWHSVPQSAAAVGSRSRQFTRKGLWWHLADPDYKFNKKPKRAKARSSGNDGGGYDGAAFTTGKRGGLVRPLGQ